MTVSGIGFTGASEVEMIYDGTAVGSASCGGLLPQCTIVTDNEITFTTPGVVGTLGVGATLPDGGVVNVVVLVGGYESSGACALDNVPGSPACNQFVYVPNAPTCYSVSASGFGESFPSTELSIESQGTSASFTVSGSIDIYGPAQVCWSTSAPLDLDSYVVTGTGTIHADIELTMQATGSISTDGETKCNDDTSPPTCQAILFSVPILGPLSLSPVFTYSASASVSITLTADYDAEINLGNMQFSYSQTTQSYQLTQSPAITYQCTSPPASATGTQDTDCFTISQMITFSGSLDVGVGVEIGLTVPDVLDLGVGPAVTLDLTGGVSSGGTAYWALTGGLEIDATASIGPEDAGLSVSATLSLFSWPLLSSSLSFSSDSPVNLLVTSPSGQLAGYTSNGSQIDEIPGAVLAGPCSSQTNEVVKVTIPNPVPGIYSVQAFPSCASTNGSAYNVSVIDSTGSQVFSAVAYEGESFQTIVTTLTTVTLSCTPTHPVVMMSVICEVTVKGSLPTGTVTWSSSDPGKFSTTACKLSRHKTYSSCAVRFTPLSVGSGSVVLTASYGGNSKNPATSGVYDLAVTARTTKTTVSCKPTSTPAGSSTPITCTVKVTGYYPTGNVTWSQSGTGSVTYASSTCSLSEVSSFTSSCFVSLTGSVPGKLTVNATYDGDANNTVSWKTHKLEIGKEVPTVTISCNSPPSLGVQVSCTATVTGYSPTGTVTWQRISGAGHLVFSSATCILSAGTCSVNVTGTRVGPLVLRTIYRGDEDNLPGFGVVDLVVTETP